VDEDVASELITAVVVRPANEHDAVAAAPLVTAQAAAVGLRPAALLGAGAFGTGDARAELRALGVEVVAKLPPLCNGDRFSKEAFSSDLAANGGTGSVTCPAGQSTSTHTWRRDERGRRIRLFQFLAAVCAACPLRPRCLGTRTLARVPAWRAIGRTITLHFHEAVLHAARAAQRTPEQRRALRERVRPRAKVERKFAELLRRHGLRQARYLGLAKTDVQAVLTATMVDIKRITALTARNADLRARFLQAIGVCGPFFSLLPRRTTRALRWRWGGMAHSAPFATSFLSRL
jgi:hypothetical protein